MNKALNKVSFLVAFTIKKHFAFDKAIQCMSNLSTIKLQTISISSTIHGEADNFSLSSYTRVNEDKLSSHGCENVILYPMHVQSIPPLNYSLFPVSSTFLGKGKNILFYRTEELMITSGR